MTIRSRLFATVALPMLSVSLAVQPAFADSLMKPFDVAQESSDPAADQPAGEGDAAAEELLRQRQQAAEEQPAAEPPPEEQQPVAEEPQPQAEEQPAAQEPAAEEPPAEEPQPQPDEQPAPEQPAAEQPAQDAPPVAEEQAPPAAEEQPVQEQPPVAEEQPVPEERPVDPQQPATEEQGQPATEQQLQTEQPAERPADAPDSTGENRPEGEPPVVEGEMRPAIDGDPANAGAGETQREPVPDVTDTRTEEEKQVIAEDPSATDETVVLPVENGAAVLDSDKDADNAGGNQSRETRRRQREELRAEDETVAPPQSDAESQASRTDRRPSREEIGAANSERGERIEEAPDFALPDLIDAITGNNDGNSRRDRRRARIEEEMDNRVVIDLGDQIIVRSDDRPRLRRNAEETYYDELPRGRTRETIERPGGVKIVTVYNRYGDILQRTRIGRDGEEYLLIYAPEADEGPRPPAYDVGDDLPPMRLRIPVRDYIIDTSSEPDRDYYDFLAEPPVERVERVYSIDEVKNSARIRDKVRRIDLDTITFATGSAEVPMSQAKTLRSVADAMQQVLEKDPGETFFIEGHTDAVGSDQSNLVLSDERAESVAVLLSEVYEIPAENLVTQGYGERFLKVRTADAEQQNRRVTIRRVTALVRPVAQAN